MSEWVVLGQAELEITVEAETMEDAIKSTLLMMAELVKTVPTGVEVGGITLVEFKGEFLNA